MAAQAWGAAFSSRRDNAWRHPWQVTPGWSPEQRSWLAQIEPGFVNAHTPIYRKKLVGKGPGRDFGTNPLTGEKYFSADVFSHSEPVPTAHSIDLPLYLLPQIPLSFYNIGFDGQPQLPVPSFFLDRNVAPAPPQPDALALLQDGGASLDLNPPPPPGLRLLRACSLILHQPRAALTSEITLQPGLVTGISNVTQTLGVRFPPSSDVLRVTTGYFNPVYSPLDVLEGIYEEPTWDELAIATVYLLSPPHTPPGTVADGTWQVFVRHALFWNLHYHTPNFRPAVNNTSVPFIPPLAGGAAQPVINLLTASLNDLTNQALNIVTAHSLAGSFWTATGGGHESVFPDPVPTSAAGKTGLDKDGRIARGTLLAAARKRARRLDPPFPFRGERFPTHLLNS